MCEEKWGRESHPSSRDVREDLNFLSVRINAGSCYLRAVDTSQSAILAGDSTNGAETAPMLEISGSPGIFPVVPAISRSMFTLAAVQILDDSIAGYSAAGSADPDFTRPRILIVSEFIVLSYDRNSLRPTRIADI